MKLAAFPAQRLNNVETCCRIVALQLTFHLHVLRLAELLLAGFLLLLLLRVVMVVVHVGSCCCCGGGYDVVLPAVFVTLDLVQGRFAGEPSSGLLVRCARM